MEVHSKSGVPPFYNYRMEMKKILLLAILISTYLTLAASERTDQEMRRIAEKQLRQLKGGTTRSGGYNVEKIIDATSYCIYATHNSYAIVSKDTRNIPILGYSDTPYDEARIPCGMRWWLNAINSTLEESAIQTTTRGGSNAVEPLLTTEWGQGEPFNLLCPTLDGKKTPSGCVATAMSQILYYFKYPETGKGTSSYTVLGGFRPWSVRYGVTYRYDIMKNKYDATTLDNLTDEEKEAISTLLLHCGAAVKMNYNADGSGATEYDATDGMATFFRYDSLALHCYRREHFTNAEWMTLLKEELAANHPILYCGQDTRYGGHAFVVDGINAEGLVHVNWGWDGDCNGYYAIDGLTPKRTVGFAHGYNFSSGQSMIVGYKLQEKPDAEDAYTSLWASGKPYKLTISSKSFVIKNLGGFYNYSWLPFDGTIALIFEEDKENGQQYKVTLDEDRFEDYQGIRFWGWGSDELDQIPFARVNSIEMPAGSYKVFLGSKDVKEQRFQPFRCGENTGKMYYSVVKNSDGSYVIDANPKQYTTNIRPITTTWQCRQEIYDLQGRPRGTDPSALPKGIYIINGKKVVK